MQIYIHIKTIDFQLSSQDDLSALLTLSHRPTETVPRSLVSVQQFLVGLTNPNVMI